MDNQQYETYELILKDDEDEVFALSLVNSPAIQSNFVYFSEDGIKEVIKFATADEEQRTIVGPILIPDMKILRMKEDGKTPYYVTFSRDTVRKIAQKYIRDNNANNITIEHEKNVMGVSLVESWVSESSKYDKSKAYGLTIKPGSWMGVFKVDNKEVWNKVKSGEYKGISLEGLFSNKLIEASMFDNDLFEKEITDLSDIEAEVVLSRMRALIKKDNRYGKGHRIEMESYSDYGSGVKGNAKRGRELNEKNGNKCATQVGKVRSAQLEAGEAISVETLKRMYSYLSRAEVYYDETDMNACGTISFLLWGGRAGLSYSRNKLRELGLIKLKEGVPHYTEDGELYEGPTHKDSEGNLMTGATHSEDSEYLYHKEDLEAQPSIPNSTYPGQRAKKIIAPALISND